jgi:hypothetical protein
MPVQCAQQLVKAGFDVAGVHSPDAPLRSGPRPITLTTTYPSSQSFGNGRADRLRLSLQHSKKEAPPVSFRPHGSRSPANRQLSTIAFAPLPSRTPAVHSTTAWAPSGNRDRRRTDVSWHGHDGVGRRRRASETDDLADRARRGQRNAALGSYAATSSPPRGRFRSTVVAGAQERHLYAHASGSLAA